MTAHPDIASLYRGAPAVAFTLHAANRAEYASALETLDEHIATVTRHRLRRAYQRIDSGQLPALREYDLISGLTGIGAYLLYRERDTNLLQDVLTYLVRLTEPVPVDGSMLPGWWCGEPPADQPAQRWPGGHGNLGLAHGIAGPLALLSAAKRRGFTVADHDEAIAGICLWLDHCRVGTGSRPWWPGRVTRHEWQSEIVAQRGPQRPSWCYGTPGIARALQLAALALGDPRRQRLAEDTLAECVTDEHQLAQLTDATLCHGWAGLLHTTWRTANDANDDGRLAATLPQLHARLMSHLNHHNPPDFGGLLEGEAGIRLVQHSVETDKPFATIWDAGLLLAG